MWFVRWLVVKFWRDLWSLIWQGKGIRRDAKRLNCEQLKLLFLDANDKERKLREKWEKLNKIESKAKEEWLKQSKVRQQSYKNYQDNRCDDLTWLAGPAPSFKNVIPSGPGWYRFSLGRWRRIDAGQCEEITGMPGRWLNEGDLLKFALDAVVELRRGK